MKSDTSSYDRNTSSYSITITISLAECLVFLLWIVPALSFPKNATSDHCNVEISACAFGVKLFAFLILKKRNS